MRSGENLADEGQFVKGIGHEAELQSWCYRQ